MRHFFTLFLIQKYLFSIDFTFSLSFPLNLYVAWYEEVEILFCYLNSICPVPHETAKVKKSNYDVIDKITRAEYDVIIKGFK